MSWTAHVPPTAVADAHEKIDACATEPPELAPQERPQLDAARAAAHALIDADVVAGEECEITLGGHVDADGTTQADYIHAQVTEWPPRETAPSEFDAATQSFGEAAEVEA